MRPGGRSSSRWAAGDVIPERVLCLNGGATSSRRGDPRDGPQMLAKLSSYTLVGIDAAPVEVEVDVSSASMPKTVLVGLAEAAVRESTHRVERALVNSGYRRPIDRVVINLAPADLKKDAGGFDLPIALGLLAGQRPGRASTGRATSPSSASWPSTGETRPIKGVLAMALAAAAEGRDGLLVPVGQRRRGGRRRGDRRLSRSAASPRPSASSPASSTSSRRSSTSRRSSASARTTRTTSSTSRARTTPSGPC